METKALTIAIIAFLAGGMIGFLAANSLNRSEIDSIRAANSIPQPAQENAALQEPALSDEEIRTRIRQADETPNDLQYQRNLGVALYRYASMKKNIPLLGESARLLKRVLAAEPSNFDINVVLGNAYFDIGYFGQDSANFVEARRYYETALSKNTGDAALRTDYGLTFFLQQPSDYARALTEFEKALKSDPKNEKALEFTTQIYLKRGDAANAQKTIDQLKFSNSTSPSIPGLTAELAAISEPAR